MIDADQYSGSSDPCKNSFSPVEELRQMDDTLHALSLVYPAHRHAILLTKAGRPIDAPCVVGVFPVAEGSAMKVLNNAWIESHAAAEHALLFCFESAKDLGVILSRINTFEARGYSVVTPSVGGEL
jgi:hypothetical protein